MKFKSIHKYLQMNVAPVEVRNERGSVVTLEKKKGIPIEFKNSVYSTTDEKEIAAIKAHPLFGMEIFEVPEIEEVKAPAGPGEPESVPAKNKNEMIKYLVGTKKVAAADMKGKNADELAAFALEQFNVKFI